MNGYDFVFEDHKKHVLAVVAAEHTANSAPKVMDSSALQRLDTPDAEQSGLADFEQLALVIAEEHAAGALLGMEDHRGGCPLRELLRVQSQNINASVSDSHDN